MVFYGNMHTSGYAGLDRSDVVMMEAKPIPGSRKVVAIFCEHMAPDHAGFVTVVDPTRGPDDRQAARRVSLEDISRDPYPLGDAGFLVAQDHRLVIMNNVGLTQTIYELPQAEGQPRWLLHEPRPLVSRAREPVVPDRTSAESPTGQLVLADVYRGRNMAGIARGTIRKLLVTEHLPKPVNLTGGMAPISYNGTFTLQRVLGTVPATDLRIWDFDHEQQHNATTSLAELFSGENAAIVRSSGFQTPIALHRHKSSGR
jgi:hypothetical protein